MPDRRDVRAGSFVLVALAILGAGTIWIAGFSPFSGTRAAYEILMKSSSGVRRGDRLRMAGIQAGRVNRVELRAGEEWPVRFHVTVDPEVVVAEGSQARITTDGLLGAPYLEIVSGPAGGPPLPSGSRIIGLEGGDIVQTLQGLGVDIVRHPDPEVQARRLRMVKTITFAGLGVLVAVFALAASGVVRLDPVSIGTNMTAILVGLAAIFFITVCLLARVRGRRETVAVSGGGKPGRPPFPSGRCIFPAGLANASPGSPRAVARLLHSEGRGRARASST